MRIFKNQINILVVDDSEASAMLMQSIFEESEMFKISIAKSVIIARTLLKKQSFELILLDLMLPKVDGFTFLKELKNNELYKNIPVVIVSALTAPDAIKKCKDLGAKAFISKPIGENKLLEKIIQILKDFYNFA